MVWPFTTEVSKSVPPHSVLTTITLLITAVLLSTFSSAISAHAQDPDPSPPPCVGPGCTIPPDREPAAMGCEGSCHGLVPLNGDEQKVIKGYDPNTFTESWPDRVYHDVSGVGCDVGGWCRTDSINPASFPSTTTTTLETTTTTEPPLPPDPQPSGAG